MRFLISAISLAVMVVACGGGGGSGGTSVGGGSSSGNGGGTTTPTTPETPNTPVAASIELELDKTVIVNSGSDVATLTVTALDSSRNPVANVPVKVVLDSGIFTPNSDVTDASGRMSGKITIGGNKSNRDIRFKLTAGGQSDSGVIAVTGSQIALTILPSMPLPGQDVQVDAKVSDVTGAAIGNIPIALSGTLLGANLPAGKNTDGSGRATWTFKAPSAQSYTLQASHCVGWRHIPGS